MTQGFKRDVPIQTQLFIFDSIQKLKQSQTEADYLQVFTLKKIASNGIDLQEIVHTQEVPPFEKSIYLSLPKEQIITTKIYVIDDGDYHTFLLASEY